MKKLHFSIVALLLFALIPGLYSQQIYSRIDSTVSCNFNSASDSSFVRKTFHYKNDSLDLHYQDKHFKWNSDSASWEPHYKVETEKSKGGDKSTEILTWWHSETVSWDYGYRQESMYDSCGRQISFVNYHQRTVEDEWGLIDSSYYRYDSTGKMLEKGILRLEQLSGEYAPMYKTDYQYNAEGDRILEIYNIWSPQGIWEEFSSKKFEYSYDANGNVSSVITSTGNKEAEEWSRIEKMEYVYDEPGFSMESVKFHPYGEDEWNPLEKFAYVYDANGNVILEERSNNFLEYPELSWSLAIQSHYSYNEKGDRELSEYYNYDGAQEAWVLTSTNELFWNRYGVDSVEVRSSVGENAFKPSVSYKKFFYRGSEYLTTCDTICKGEEFIWRGISYGTQGIYGERFISSLGNDSIYKLVLEVGSIPEAFGITDIEGLDMVCQGQSLYYCAPQNPEVEYRWKSDGGEILSGANRDTVFVQWVGDWNASLKAWSVSAFGCVSDTAMLSVEIAICDHVDASSASDFSMYPVPVQDRLFIEASSSLSIVEVIDARGVLVLKSCHMQDGVDFSNLPGGIYLVRILDPEGVPMVSRFVVKTA